MSAKGQELRLPSEPTEAQLSEAWKRRQEHNLKNLNCITHWYPKIKGVVPTPETEILSLQLTREMDRQLWGYLDGEAPPVWFRNWIEFKLKPAAAGISMDGPWFLRSGLTSGKHNWRNCCYVPSLETIGQHVLSIFEYSQMVDMMGLAYNVWAVREFLPGPCLTFEESFMGMPVRREFRCFASGGAVRCVHPYWPKDAFSSETPNDSRFEEMNALEPGTKDYQTVLELASLASAQFPPSQEWSIDVLSTENGWYVTDMAVAAESYHWPTCERAAR